MCRFTAAAIAALMAAGTIACGAAEDGTAAAPANMKVLMDPNSDAMKEEAPAKFKAHFETSKGVFVIEVERKLAPRGADRFYNLVRHGYYNECRFFRVVKDFIIQWGMHGDPKVTKTWFNANIQDDPVHISNERGTITYAKQNSPNTRTTQLFLNLKDNAFLDRTKFAPFGRVVEGMDVVDSITAEYGEAPSQQKVGEQGNAYLKKNFPNLDYIIEAKIL